jgi:hypothetical protein
MASPGDESRLEASSSALPTALVLSFFLAADDIAKFVHAAQAESEHRAVDGRSDVRAHASWTHRTGARCDTTRHDTTRFGQSDSMGIEAAAYEDTIDIHRSMA